MNELLSFEFKKIAGKRFNMVVVLCSILLTAILFWLPVKQYIVLTLEGKQVQGREAISLEKKYENQYAGELTENKVKIDIEDYQALFENKENLSLDKDEKTLNKKAASRYLYPYIPYWKLINGVYLEPNIYDSNYTRIAKISTENGIEFYNTRIEKVKKMLNQTYCDSNYSEKEKNFWISRVEDTKEPIIFGYHAGWLLLFYCLELLLVAILAICICITPIFSGEYQSGADSLILATRYGKSKLIRAKVKAAFLFGTIIFALHVLVAIIILLSGFGTNGFSLPLQVLNATIPYNFTMLQAVVVCVITDFLVMFGMISLILLMSANMNSSLPTMAVALFILLLPLFFGYSETNGIWNHILTLLPATAMQPVWPDDYNCFVSYSVFGKIFDVVSIRIIVYVILPIICVPLAGVVFKRHQVK